MAFIATNVDLDNDDDDNPNSGLNRYEFLEIIVRMGIEKYFKSCREKTIKDSVVRVLKENFLNFYTMKNLPNSLEGIKTYMNMCVYLFVNILISGEKCMKITVSAPFMKKLFLTQLQSLLKMTVMLKLKL